MGDEAMAEALDTSNFPIADASLGQLHVEEGVEDTDMVPPSFLDWNSKIPFLVPRLALVHNNQVVVAAAAPQCLSDDRVEASQDFQNYCFVQQECMQEDFLLAAAAAVVVLVLLVVLFR
jgi:hypothetical protein